jgi:glycerol uptake facilitator-like aquaporin
VSTDARAPLSRRLLAEGVGIGLLVTVVVGSGIAAQRLSPNDAGLALLENSLTTVLGLGVLILLFGPVSGAHFNPVVSAADWALGRRTGSGLSGRDVTAYSAVQTVGGPCSVRSWPTPCSTWPRSRSRRRCAPHRGCGSGRSSRPPAWSR